MPRNASTSQMNPLPSLIRASAWDAGNFSARDNGRKVWNEDDANAAAECQRRLIESCYGEGPMGCIRFGYAEAMERAGLLSLSTKDFFGELDRSFAAYEASLAEAA